MGQSHSAKIKIELDRPNQTYFTGDTVRGATYVTVVEKDMNIDGIFIIIAGESGYTTQRTVTDSNGSSRTETDYHCIRFFHQKVAVNWLEKKQKMELQSGEYSWPFSFQLPNDLPPSLNDPESYPHVRYYIHFLIDRPWYRHDPKETSYFTVIPPVHIMQNPSLLDKSHFGNQNRKKVSLNGLIERLAYLPGEYITGRYEIHNPERVKIKEITIKLIQYYKIQCNTNSVLVAKVVSPLIKDTKSEFVQEEFSIQIPVSTKTPSYEFHGGYDQHTDVSHSYSLVFNANLSGIFTDFNVPIPITVASMSNIHGTVNPSAYSETSASRGTEMIDPVSILPSYDELSRWKT